MVTTVIQFHTPEQSVGVFVAAVRNLDILRDRINDVIVSGTPENSKPHLTRCGTFFELSGRHSCDMSKLCVNWHELSDLMYLTKIVLSYSLRFLSY